MKNGNEEPQNSSSGNGKSGNGSSTSSKSRDGRKSGKPAKRSRYRQIVNAAKLQATKGKNRRVVFKKNVRLSYCINVHFCNLKLRLKAYRLGLT